MSFLNKFFGSGTKNSQPDKSTVPWKPLTSKDQLETIDLESKNRTQVIFKHSTRCGISRMVMNQFVSSYDDTWDMDLYYLDLLSNRDVSDEVGYKFQVMHQSPQLIVVRNGETVAHASHASINEIELEKYS